MLANVQRRMLMRYTLSGTVMQTVAIDLLPGEVVYSQTNSTCWMNDAIEMDTHTGGGFFAGLRRSASGGSFFITDFIARGKAQARAEREASDEKKLKSREARGWAPGRRANARPSAQRRRPHGAPRWPA